MLRVLLVGIVVCAVCTAASGDDVTLTSIDVRADAANPNILANGGFESAGADGIPAGWKWDKRNTNATCVIDDRPALDGTRCVKFTCKSPLESGVYAELSIAKPVTVQPGRPCTLSLWTMSVDPGFARIGGGADWRYHFTLPATSGRWRRVSMTFTPTEADKSFDLSIVIKGTTGGLWVDDVKLEPGARPTLDAGDAVRCCPENYDAEITSDGGFEVPFTVYAPKPMSLTLEAGISKSERPVTRQVALEAGASRVVISGQSNASDSPRVVTLRLLDGGKEVVAAVAQASFSSPASARARLAKLEGRLPGFKASLDQLKASGQDISYPRVSYTVLENFIGYAREDAEKGDVKRSIAQIGELESMADQLDRGLSQAVSGRLTFPAVPKWIGDTRPIVKGSSFIAPTITPGKPGRETRPVFFTGYGHFAQVRKDIEKWPDYGTNIIQFEIGPWSVFPSEGVVEEHASDGILKELDRARKAGVAINLLISPHYFPGWMLTKYPELRKRREGFQQYCLHAPEGRELLKEFVSVVIAPIKNHPALHSICISNEPQNVEEPCEYAANDWHAWLAKRHGDIATLNSRWGTSYAGFDDVPLPNPFAADARTPMPRYADYVRWNQEFFADWHKMLADAVHAVAPDLPVHAKVQTWTLGSAPNMKYGNDAYLCGRVCDINGNDSSNMYGFGESAYAQSWLENDMVRRPPALGQGRARLQLRKPHHQRPRDAADPAGAHSNCTLAGGDPRAKRDDHLGLGAHNRPQERLLRQHNAPPRVRESGRHSQLRPEPRCQRDHGHPASARPGARPARHQRVHLRRRGPRPLRDADVYGAEPERGQGRVRDRAAVGGRYRAASADDLRSERPACLECGVQGAAGLQGSDRHDRPRLPDPR